MRALVVIAASCMLAACGGSDVAYRTPCGMDVVATGYEPDPYDAAALERAAVAYRLVACPRIAGWRLISRSDSAWHSPRHGIRIAGVTHCRTQTVEIGFAATADDFRAGAFIHELVHVGECPWENYDHVGWEDEDAHGLTTYERIGAVRSGAK